MANQSYNWFDNVNADVPLMQGDIIRQCPVLVPVWSKNIDFKKDEVVETETLVYDVVIMSQSCDLVLGKLQLVLVCPMFPLTELAEKNREFSTPKGKENLRRGYQPNYHLLVSPDERDFKDKYLVVDFRSVYGVGSAFIGSFSKASGNRFRLLPPYREHLSQAFARFFMRVGLPTDIPEFK